MAKAKKAIPEGFRTVTPQLVMDRASQAIDWYKKALGAEEVIPQTGFYRVPFRATHDHDPLIH